MMLCYGIFFIYMYELLFLYVVIISLKSVHMHNISVNLMVSKFEFGCVICPQGLGDVTPSQALTHFL
jgi:hypothetical protein